MSQTCSKREKEEEEEVGRSSGSESRSRNDCFKQPLYLLRTGKGII